MLKGVSYLEITSQKKDKKVDVFKYKANSDTEKAMV
jgi:ribosomal protein L21